MTSITPVYVATPQKTNQYKTERQVANATITAAGVGATAYAGNKLINKISRLEAAAVKTAQPTKGVIETAFRKKGFLGRALDKVSDFACKMFEKLGNTKFVKDAVALIKKAGHTLSKSKTVAAVAITGALTVLGLVGKAIYNAGKINGQQ